MDLSYTQLFNKGEFMVLKMTKGNVDDRTPVPELTKGLTGIMAADKGYSVLQISSI